MLEHIFSPEYFHSSLSSPSVPVNAVNWRNISISNNVALAFSTNVQFRTGCANERPSASVRGAVSNDRPYRDLIDPHFAGKRRKLVKIATGRKF